MPILLGPYLAETAVGMGVMGAIISGTNAAAKNIERVRTGSASEKGALIDVGNEVVKNGVATAATFAVVASLGVEIVAAVGVTLIVGTTLKYAWDRGRDAVEKDLGNRKNRPVKSSARVAKVSPARAAASLAA